MAYPKEICKAVWFYSRTAWVGYYVTLEKFSEEPEKIFPVRAQARFISI
jgi:hypothetical protein